VLFDFYTCLYLVIASFLSGFIIAWFSRLFTIKKIRKTIDDKEKQINILTKDVDLVTEHLESCTLSSNAYEKQTKIQEQQIEALKNSNEQLQNKVSDFSFPSEKISIIKDKKDLGKELDILRRIKAKKYQIDFDRIGYASNLNKNNLKLIVGIGDFIEQKLNALGIYTFIQIANFTAQDVHLITDAIEFFPGQIEKDKWVAQAQKIISNTAENENSF